MAFIIGRLNLGRTIFDQGWFLSQKFCEKFCEKKSEKKYRGDYKVPPTGDYKMNFLDFRKETLG